MGFTLKRFMVPMASAGRVVHYWLFEGQPGDCPYLARHSRAICREHLRLIGVDPLEAEGFTHLLPVKNAADSYGFMSYKIPQSTGWNFQAAWDQHHPKVLQRHPDSIMDEKDLDNLAKKVIHTGRSKKVQSTRYVATSDDEPAVSIWKKSNSERFWVFTNKPGESALPVGELHAKIDTIATHLNISTIRKSSFSQLNVQDSAVVCTSHEPQTDVDDLLDKACNGQIAWTYEDKELSLTFAEVEAILGAVKVPSECDECFGTGFFKGFGGPCSACS